MIILDANILIALFDPADAHHARAEQLLNDHADEPMALSALTLTEFLIRPTAAGLASRAQAFIGNMGIIVSPVLGDDASRLAQVRVETGLKLPDAVMLWLAISSSADLLTLDDHLADVAGSVGVTVV
ncbi:MAG: PIN domain-containing protein [Propionibacteriaceae bacterium]|nr:PIN domain-containing protein [Propionibacteriaceae bacterium]